MGGRQPRGVPGGAAALLPQRLLTFLSSSERAVDEFIILSGFVITHLVLTRPEPYRVYLNRRAWRIVPIYLVCMLLALFLVPQQQALHTAPWVGQWRIWLVGSRRCSRISRCTWPCT